MWELDWALKSNRFILPVYYGIVDEKDLPTDKSAFLDAFAGDDRVDEEMMERWWDNVSVKLPKIQAIYRSHYGGKRRDVDLADKIIKCVKPDRSVLSRIIKFFKQLLPIGSHRRGGGGPISPSNQYSFERIDPMMVNGETDAQRNLIGYALV